MTEKTKHFIKKAIEIHGDKLDYSKVNYINAKTNIILICQSHGDFELTPNKHLSSKRGCQLCSTVKQYNEKRDTTEDFNPKKLMAIDMIIQ
jgi:hypothetical protein